MSEEIKELKETLERSLQNPSLIDREKTERFYKGIINLQQKVEQLESIRKEVIEYVKSKEFAENFPYVMNECQVRSFLLNILNKGSEEDE